LALSPIPQRPSGFRNAVVENIATGATIVINKAARDLLLTVIPKKALMHDWWTYLVISALGQVVYDPEPCIKYRLHESNAVGWKLGFIDQLKDRTKRYIRERGLKKVKTQVSEFFSIYGEQLDTEKRIIIERFLLERKTFSQRVRYCFFNTDLYRQTTLDNFILRWLILFDKI
ncbi:MAG: glycosyltransferase family 2 protein, partial [Ignavibacteriales bacterium]